MMRGHRPTRGQVRGGFTLVELIFAVMVIAIAATGASAYLGALQKQRQARDGRVRAWSAILARANSYVVNGVSTGTFVVDEVQLTVSQAAALGPQLPRYTFAATDQRPGQGTRTETQTIAFSPLLGQQSAAARQTYHLNDRRP